MSLYAPGAQVNQTGSRTTYAYQVIPARRAYIGKCPVCGKQVSRSRTFEMTVNPWNKNEDGTVRTRVEVRQAVDIEADKWIPDFLHEKCRIEVAR